MKSLPQTRKESFLGRTQKHKKAVGVRAGRGKCGAIKSTFSIVTQGDVMDEVTIMMIEGCRSGPAGLYSVVCGCLQRDLCILS